ncbi:hypothetical protein L596_011026 [Steinernema carpocapsae]|uniref:PH domain-containing protein n=1 Tax=Steinernema carpocapsae TaxID=34508 RepID=A0A4U5NTH3_STECR|nr:hypothetical protein L596_011026 [Steinernema carpocapsae]
MQGLPITSTPRHSPTHSSILDDAKPDGPGMKRFDDSFISAITVGSRAHYRPFANANDPEYEEEFQRLKRLLAVQEDQIMQSCSALDHCRQHHHSNGTLQELTAHRILVLAKERKSALLGELERLRTRNFQPVGLLPTGSVELSSIKIHLNRNFCLKNTDTDSSYAFIVLLKCGENVYASQVVSVMDVGAMRVRTVRFPDNVRFDGLRYDFVVNLSVFALKVENRTQKPAKNHCFLKRKLMQLFAPLRRRSMKSELSSGCHTGVGSYDFTRCGFATLSKDYPGLQKLILNEAKYPLEGTVEIRASCNIASPEVQVEFEGFLSMYQMVQNFGSWNRFFAILRRGGIKFYLYPDDEICNKPPRAYIDMEKVANDYVTCCKPEICSRPNTFYLDIYVNSAPSYAHAQSVYTLKRVILNADNHEMCENWMMALNETLSVIRGGQCAQKFGL